MSVESSAKLLTEREWQVAKLVAQGLSNKEIGRHLDISEGTIKVHLHNIYQKLTMSNRTSLAVWVNKLAVSSAIERSRE